RRLLRIWIGGARPSRLPFSASRRKLVPQTEWFHQWFGRDARTCTRDARAPPRCPSQIGFRKRVPVRPAMRDATSCPCGIRISNGSRSTSPRPSPPRRGRILRRSSKNSRDWICRPLIRKTKNDRRLFLLLGEKVGMRASVKHKSHSPNRPSQMNLHRQQFSAGGL